jgi:outer membrane protein OmpA-like peptidoglycan-associated protein
MRLPALLVCALLAATIWPGTSARAAPSASGCAAAAAVIDRAQQRGPIQGGPQDLKEAKQAVTLCDSFETELFLARIEEARRDWPESIAAYGRARGFADRDLEKVSQVDMELALLAADQGPACEAVATFDATADALARRHQAIPEGFTRARMKVEGAWTANGLTGGEISCALKARGMRNRALRLPGEMRLFCDELTVDIPVNFATDSAGLDARAAGQVAQLAIGVHNLLGPSDQIRLDGHADERGPDTLNQHLSEQRASSVAQALAARLGLPDTRMQTRGHGNKQPKYSGHDEAAYRLNRRVEVTLVPAQCSEKP